MDSNKPEDTALFRYGIIAPLVSGTVDKDISNRQFFMEASEKTYEDPCGKPVKVSWYTIARWYDTYRKEGFDGLKPLYVVFSYVEFYLFFLILRTFLFKKLHIIFFIFRSFQEMYCWCIV